MGRLTDAMNFAIAAHGEVRRKGDGLPAVLHAMEAAAVAASLTSDEEVLAAAVLHDTVEDAGVDLEDIRARFGERVAGLVWAESEDKMRGLPPEESWRARKEGGHRPPQGRAGPGRHGGPRRQAVQPAPFTRAGEEKERRCGRPSSEGPAAASLVLPHHRRDSSPQDATAASREYDWLIRQVFEEE